MDGFATLGWPHVLMLACCAAAGAVLVYFTQRPGYMSMFAAGADRRREVRACPPLIKAACAVLLCLEIIQDLYLIAAGLPLADHLPLHLCGLGIFANFIGAFSNSRFAAALREVSLVLIAPGAVFALLFPDWTYMNLLSIMSVIGFAGHTLLAVIPLMMLKAGAVRPAWQHIWYTPAFLAVTCPPVYLFDTAFGYNYMFLRHPVENTPLAWWADRLGEPGYLLGILLMAAAVLLLEYCVLCRKRKRG